MNFSLICTTIKYTNQRAQCTYRHILSCCRLFQDEGFRQFPITALCTLCVGCTMWGTQRRSLSLDRFGGFWGGRTITHSFKSYCSSPNPIRKKNHQSINGHFRILNWSYCTLHRPYFVGIFPEFPLNQSINPSHRYVRILAEGMFASEPRMQVFRYGIDITRRPDAFFGGPDGRWSLVQ